MQNKNTPDFQVRYARQIERILVLDPGDPENQENSQSKHLRWLDIWQDAIGDGRYATRLWNEGNPENKIDRKSGNDYFPNIRAKKL